MMSIPRSLKSLYTNILTICGLSSSSSKENYDGSGQLLAISNTAIPTNLAVIVLANGFAAGASCLAFAATVDGWRKTNVMWDCISCMKGTSSWWLRKIKLSNAPLCDKNDMHNQNICSKGL